MFPSITFVSFTAESYRPFILHLSNFLLMSSQLLAAVFAVSSQAQNHNIFFCSCETHVKFLLFLSPKKLISFGVGIAILLYWQWQPTSLPLISPVVHAKVIKENTKLDLSLKNSSSQAPCCLKFFPLVLLVAVFSLHSCLLTGFLNWHLVSIGNALLKSTYVRLTEFLLSKM